MGKDSTLKRAPKRQSKPALTERQIEEQIVDLCKAHQWLVLHTNRFKTGGAVIVQGSIEKGMPDLQLRRREGSRQINILSNVCREVPWWRIIWAEIKRPGKRLSHDQRIWHLVARMRGEETVVWHSLEEAAEYIGVKL